MQDNVCHANIRITLPKKKSYQSPEDINLKVLPSLMGFFFSFFYRLHFQIQEKDLKLMFEVLFLHDQ